jgi:hypothetical protein
MLADAAINDLVLRFAEAHARMLAYRHRRLLCEADAYEAVAKKIEEVAAEYGFNHLLAQQRTMIDYQHGKEVAARGTAAS